MHYVFPAGRVLTTDDFRGASVELPPGGWKMTMPLSGALGLARVFGMRLPRASRTQVFFERNHLQEPHYYIRTLGLATPFQDRGLGSRRSAALYERLGFAHLGELRIPDGGPPFWPMRRPPEAA